MMNALEAISAMFTVTSASIASTIQQQEQIVVIDEGVRPTDVVRTFAGQCGSVRYAIAIRPGRKLEDALESATADGIDATAALRLALRERPMGRVTIDGALRQCERDRVRVQFQTTSEGNPANVNFHALWLTSAGAVSWDSNQ
jgi:hypothetical protein